MGGEPHPIWAAHGPESGTQAAAVPVSRLKMDQIETADTMARDGLLGPPLGYNISYLPQFRRGENDHGLFLTKLFFYKLNSTFGRVFPTSCDTSPS